MPGQTRPAPATHSASAETGGQGTGQGGSQIQGEGVMGRRQETHLVDNMKYIAGQAHGHLKVAAGKAHEQAKAAHAAAKPHIDAATAEARKHAEAAHAEARARAEETHRRYQANLKNKEAQRSLKTMHTMCMIIPVRLGIWAYAVINVVVCFVLLLRMAGCDTAECRGALPFAGYHHYTRVILCLLNLFGVVMGLAGIVGCWYQEAEKVQIFFTYQMLRLFFWVLIILIDGNALHGCETWIKDIHTMVEENPWNPIVYQIALDHGCRGARWALFVGSSVIVLIFIYWALATYQLLNDMKDDPAWLLDCVKSRMEMDEISSACPISRPKLPHGPVDGRFAPDATGHMAGHAGFSEWTSMDAAGDGGTHYGINEGHHYGQLQASLSKQHGTQYGTTPSRPTGNSAMDEAGYRTSHLPGYLV